MSSWACFIAACVIYPSCMMFAAIAEVTDLRRGFIESSFRDLCTVAIACLAISTCHNLRRLTNKLRCPLSKANRRHNHVHGSNSTRVRARLCDGSNAPANSRSARFALFLRDGSLPRFEAGSAFALHDVGTHSHYGLLTLPLKGAYSSRAPASRCLLVRPDCYRLERNVPGGSLSLPLKSCAGLTAHVDWHAPNP